MQEGADGHHGAGLPPTLLVPPLGLWCRAGDGVDVEEVVGGGHTLVAATCLRAADVFLVCIAVLT